MLQIVKLFVTILLSKFTCDIKFLIRIVVIITMTNFVIYLILVKYVLIPNLKVLELNNSAKKLQRKGDELPSLVLENQG